MNIPSYFLNAIGKHLRQQGVVTLLFLLAGCSSGPHTPGISLAGRPVGSDGAPSRIPSNLDAVPDAVPRYEPRTRAGNPESYEVYGKRYYVMHDSRDYAMRGIASWYGSKFHGLKTSNGEQYDMFAMTAAHKTLPIPCYARVTNLENGRSITVRINDRGPFMDERVIDLSYIEEGGCTMYNWAQLQASIKPIYWLGAWARLASTIRDLSSKRTTWISACYNSGHS